MGGKRSVGDATRLVGVARDSTANTVETMVPPINATTTRANNADTVRLRRTQRNALSAAVIGRAWMGSPERKCWSSSRSSWVVW